MVKKIRLADKHTAGVIFKILNKTYPKSKIGLHFQNPLEVLVATVLSAQCTDKRVNLVTGKIFKKYRTVKDYACADTRAFEKDIRSTGFYRNKAKNIINACKRIITAYGSKVPDSMQELLTLPGVARKTANIVLYSGFGKIEGIAVDTHVSRLSRRLGFSAFDDPVKIEKDLMQLFKKKSWGKVSHLLISHGRNICIARKPKCHKCRVIDYCPYGIKEWRCFS